MDIERDELIVELFQRTPKPGMREIARRAGCSYGTVRKVLLSRGFELSKRGGDRTCRKAWKGGRVIRKDGYVWIHTSRMPEAVGLVKTYSNYFAEHRAVMAVALGRPLNDTEQVHHIDGDRMNNDILNLQLRTRSHGSGAVLCCADCGSRNIEGLEI